MSFRSFSRRSTAAGAFAVLAIAVGACAAPPKSAQDGTGQNAAGAPTKSSAAKAASAATDLKSRAEAGDLQAQLDYAAELVKTDPKAAANWYERAALQGQGGAAYQLGLMQDDPKRAIEWFSMASAMNHAGAQYQLGDAYLHGRGTAKEPGWGLMWFERAARAGNPDGQYALGVALATGMVGSPQREDALVWLTLAKNNDHANTDILIAALQARMSAEMLARVAERVAAWTAEPVSETAGDRATLRFAQYALGRLGYAPGPADGIIGERTTSAIEAFRAKHGLGIGDLDRRTLDRLRDQVAELDH